MTHRSTTSAVAGSAVLSAALVVGAWRALAAFARRWRELATSGRLERRIRLRRERRVAVAVHAALRADAVAALQPVAPPAVPVPDDDIDDMGLLARSMNRRPARPLVVPIADPEPVPPPTPEFPAELFEPVEVAEAPAPWGATVLAAASALAAVPALVRPLEPWSPWAVGAAVLLGSLAWLVARRRAD